MLSPFRVPSQRSFSPEQLDQRLRAGLVGHWIGGGSGNTWFDQSGYGNHGTLTNGPTWTLGQDGKRNAMQFDGSNDYVNPPLSKSKIGTTPTFSLWVYPIGAQSTVCALAIQDGLSHGIPWVLCQRASPTTFKWYLDGGYRITETVNDGVWTHLAAAYDGAVWQGYVNGVATTNYTGASGTQSGNSTWFGNGFNGYFNGKIDDVRIYNRALSAAEIALLASPSFSPVIQPARSFSRVSTGNRRRRVICGGIV